MHCKVIKHNLFHNNVTASSNINISILKVTQQGQQKRRKSLRSKRPKQHQHKQRWELNEDRNETKSRWKFFKQQGRGAELQWSQSSICHQARLLLFVTSAVYGDIMIAWSGASLEIGQQDGRVQVLRGLKINLSSISLDYHDHGIA